MYEEAKILSVLDKNDCTMPFLPLKEALGRDADTTMRLLLALERNGFIALDTLYVSDEDGWVITEKGRGWYRGMRKALFHIPS